MTTDMQSAEASSPIEDPSPENWFVQIPDDWAGWLAFRSEAVATPLARNSLRDWMSSHLDEKQDGLKLGLGWYAAGQADRAKPLLEGASGDLAALLAALATRTTGDVAGAERLLAKLTDSAKVGAAACLSLASIHAGRRDLDALTADIDTIKKAKGSAADIAFVQGLAAEADGDHQAALDLWRGAVESDPKHVEAIFELARLLDRSGDDEAALELLEPFRTGALPAHRGALMNLGILYEDSERHDWARTCFAMVVNGDPTDARARRYLADAEAALEQYYDESRERRADKHNAVLRIPVTDFELSVRARNCLQKMSIHTLGDLVSRSESELLSFKNFGETSLQEVKEILQAKNLRLGMLPTSAEVLTPIEAVASAHGGDVTEILISELDLSVRSRAALATLGITRVAELTDTTETTLLSCKNFGQTSLDEIRSKLRQLGLDLVG